MNAKNNQSSDKNNSSEFETETEKKTCFVIMPIADHPDYPAGHFTRVYNHLIKPACEIAGFEAVRADDAKASHMIMFDILKKIADCDMAICDLSSKNANVFYELGLRQAFNKKTILITDNMTNIPFDITGFRYVKYSESLRIDTVLRDTNEITAMLKETEQASEDDINSIVSLLKIQPAKINKVELSQHDSVIFDLIKNLDAKINNLTLSRKDLVKNELVRNGSLGLISGKSFQEISEHFSSFLRHANFVNGDIALGKYMGRNETGDLVFSNGERTYYVSSLSADQSSIRAL